MDSSHENYLTFAGGFILIVIVFLLINLYITNSKGPKGETYNFTDTIKRIFSVTGKQTGNIVSNLSGDVSDSVKTLYGATTSHLGSDVDILGERVTSNVKSLGKALYDTGDHIKKSLTVPRSLPTTGSTLKTQQETAANQALNAAPETTSRLTSTP